MHGEQGIVWRAPIPAAATVTGHTRVTDVVDNGAEKARSCSRTRSEGCKDRRITFTLIGTTVMRGDGDHTL